MRCVRTCPAVDKGRRTEEPDSQMASAASTTSYTLHQLGFRAVAPIPPGAWHFQPPPATQLLPAHTPAQADRRLHQAIMTFQNVVSRDTMESVD